MKKALFNPLPHDFSYEYLDEENKSHLLTIKSLEVKFFEGYMYNFMKKHLIDEIINTEDLGYLTPEEYKKVEKRVLHE